MCILCSFHNKSKALCSCYFFKPQNLSVQKLAGGGQYGIIISNSEGMLANAVRRILQALSEMRWDKI